MIQKIQATRITQLSRHKSCYGLVRGPFEIITNSNEDPAYQLPHLAELGSKRMAVAVDAVSRETKNNMKGAVRHREKETEKGSSYRPRSVSSLLMRLRAMSEVCVKNVVNCDKDVDSRGVAAEERKY